MTTPNTRRAERTAAPVEDPPAGAPVAEAARAAVAALFAAPTPHPAEESSPPNTRTSGGAPTGRRAMPNSTPKKVTPGGVNSRQAVSVPVPVEPAPAGAPPAGPQGDTAAHRDDGAGAYSHPAERQAQPEEAPPGGPHNSRRAVEVAAPDVSPPAGVSSHPTARTTAPDVGASGGVGPAGRRRVHDTRTILAAGGPGPGPGPAAIAITTPEWASLLDPALPLAADVVDDLERVRIANENRLRQLTRTEVDEDGVMRGFGLDLSHPDVARLAGIVATMHQLEGDAVKGLERAMRRHPLGPWGKAIRGVGEKQLARLLAAIGDPYWRPELVRDDGSALPAGPRTVSQLWAFAGLHVLPASDRQDPDTPVRPVGGGPDTAGRTAHDAHSSTAGGHTGRGTQDESAAGVGGDPGHGMPGNHNPVAGVAPRRRRGVRANWSTNAKTRAYLIAASCIKQLDPGCRGGHFIREDQSSSAAPVTCGCSPYRVVYDTRRAHTAVTRPDWSDGHSHNDALRVAAKALLRDLWRESKRLHEQAGVGR